MGFSQFGERFPKCSELIVTKISNFDSLLITVQNNCNSCSQHVYTGLTVFSKNDTIAKDIWPFSNPNPKNDSVYEYQLIKNQDFEISKITNITMNGLCDSIQYDPAIVDLLNTKTTNEITSKPGKSGVNISVSEKSLRVWFEYEIQVGRINIFDTNGKNLAQSIITNKNIILNLPKETSGLIYINFQMEKNEFLKKVLIR